MKKLLLPVVIFMVFVFGSAGLRAQTTVFGPEQDCVNALTICQPLIKQPYSYKGDGYRILELLNSPACLPSPGEKNGVWYRLKAGASGKLGFTITALDASDNYDWAVFRAPLVSDAIDNACIRIKSDATLLIGCNASNLPLPTGPNDGVGEQNSAKIDVNAGETILIYISNFSGKSGFVLDLSSSSAGVVPTAPATTKPTMTVAPVQTSDATGCKSVTEINVTFSPAVLCSTVLPEKFALSGPGATYTIVSVTTAVCGDNRNPSFMNTSTYKLVVSPAMSVTGTYTLSTTGTNPILDACMNPVDLVNKTQSFLLNVGNTPPALKASETTVCLGRSTTLSTDDLGTGTKYEWFAGSSTTPIDGQTGPTFQIFTKYQGEVDTVVQRYYQSVNTAPIAYKVRVTDINGCVRTSNPVTISVSADAAPVITASGSGIEVTGSANNQSVIFCANSTVSLSVAAGFAGYQWLREGVKIAAPLGTAATYLANEEGTYTVEVTKADGCKNQPAVIVLNTKGLTSRFITGPKVICDGGSIELTMDTSGIQPISWLLDGSEVSKSFPKFSATKAGKYQVQFVNDQGCVLLAELSVTQSTAPTRPTINPSNTSRKAAVCEGDPPFPLDAGADPVTKQPYSKYTWFLNGTVIENATTQTYNATKNGQYTVQALNADGCTSIVSESFTVTVTAKPKVEIFSATGVFSFCKGESLKISAGAGFSTYTWTEGGKIISTAQEITVTKTGTYTVTVQQLNSDGTSCQNSSSATVTEIDNPKPPITTNTGKNSFCDGESLILDAGTGFTRYEWTRQGSATIIGTSQKLTVTQAGVYSVNVVIGNCTGSSDPFTVTVDSKPTVPTISGSLSLCVGSTTVLSVPDVAGQTYQWLLDGAVIAGETKRTLTASKKGSYNVEIKNAAGCSNKAASDAVVTEVPLPTAPRLKDSTILCPGGTATLDGGEGYTTYQWSRNGVQLTDATAKSRNYVASQAGSYTVVVGNSNGCTIQSVNTAFVVPSSLKVSITEIDFGVRYRATPSGSAGPFSYQWLLNGKEISGATSEVYGPQVEGSYNVRVTDRTTGCSDTAQAPKAFVLPKVIVEGGPSGSSTTLTNITAKPGDTVTVVIKVSSLGSLQPGAQISGILQFNATLLEPLPNKGTVTNGIRQIPVTVTLPANVGSILDSLQFRAALGNDSTTAIRLDSVKLVASGAPLASASASFTLTNISYAGGARLIGPPPKVVLKPTSRPNPAIDVAVIDYELFEPAEMLFTINDMFGRVVKTMYLGKLTAGTGEIVFDVTDLQPGVYFGAVRTNNGGAAFVKMRVAR